MKKIVKLSVVLIMFVFLSGLHLTNNTISSNNNVSKDDVELEIIHAALSDYPSIIIDEDSDFGPTGYDFSGNGSVSDPYIIENFNITTLDGSAIQISSTTSHFVIRYCYLDADIYGVNISKIATGTAKIYNNTCFDSGDFYDRSVGAGIYIEYTDIVSITNNTLKYNYNGINLRHADYVNCSNNLAIENYFTGIYATFSYHGRIEENICIDSNYMGISISNSDYTVIANNTMYNCGLIVSGWSSFYQTLDFSTDNYVNNKLFGYFIDLTAGYFDDNLYGQMFFFNCSNMVIKDYILTNASVGLTLEECANVSIENCDVSNNVGSMNQLQGCGISTRYSTNITFSNCIVVDCSVGIYILPSTENFNPLGYFIIEHNIVEKCRIGLYLVNAKDITAINNSISFNYLQNPYESEGRGISGSAVTNSTFANNRINDNSGYGISLGQYSDSNKIYSNFFKRNYFYGIRLRYSSYNTIYNNTFLSNGNQWTSSQCYDDEGENYWFNPLTNKGNWWSDFSGYGTYSIQGSSAAKDLYPEGPITISEFSGTTLLTLIMISISFVGLVSLPLKKKR